MDNFLHKRRMNATKSLRHKEFLNNFLVPW